MFFGTNFLGQPPQQQEDIQVPEGYQSRVAPGSGQVMSGSVPQSVDMGMVPYANQAVTGVGTANTNGMPGMVPGLPPGVAPTPYVAPPQNPIEGVVEEAGTTGDPMVDGAIQQGMAPAAIPFREPMSTSRKLTGLGMMMAAAGTDSFTRVAGTVQAGMAQDQASVEKYNRDLQALTTEQSELVEVDGLFKIKRKPPAYKISADGSGIEFVGYKDPYFTEAQGGDFREPKAPAKRETAKSADGYLRYTDTGELVYPDQYEEGIDISAEGVMSAQRFLRQEIDKDITPIENEINQINLGAQTAAAVYMDSESTDADKTEADRSLVKLVEKLWDPTSAVLGGEFETAQAAQSWFDQKMRQFDFTSGESLGPDKRRALLGVLRSVGEQKASIYNNRARDLTSRAGSTFGRYKDSQVAGAIEGSLPEAWRTAPDGTVGGAGDYYDRGLDPAWEAMMQSPWWTGNASPDPDTETTDVDAELENAAAEMIKSYSDIYMGSGR